MTNSIVSEISSLTAKIDSLFDTDNRTSQQEAAYRKACDKRGRLLQMLHAIA